MNAYTRELLEREAILLQSRRDAQVDEAIVAAQPCMKAVQPVTAAIHPRRNAREVMRTATNSLWQLLQTPIPDLLFGRPISGLFA